MTDPLVFLTSISVILLIGIVSSIISSKLRIPNMFLLIIVGILLSRIRYGGAELIQFPPLFLTSMSILALVMIVFDASSKLKIRELDVFSISAMKLTLLFLLLSMIVMSVAARHFFGIKSLLLAVMFSAIVVGTSPSSVFMLFKPGMNKVTELLKIESIFNTPLVVIIPFIMIDLMRSIDPRKMMLSTFFSQLLPFLQLVVTGIGAGVLVGLIVFKLMRRHFSQKVSPVAIVTAAILAYILAENLGGNGVISVTTLGIVFGSVYLKEKDVLSGFSSMFANALEILVFVLVGFIILIPFEFSFFLKSGFLFIILLLVRFATIEVSVGGDYNLREKVFMTLNAPKGIEVAVIAFIMTTMSIIPAGYSNAVPLVSIPGVKEILDLILIFILYSIALSAIVSRFSAYFVNVGMQEAV